MANRARADRGCPQGCDRFHGCPLLPDSPNDDDHSLVNNLISRLIGGAPPPRSQVGRGEERIVEIGERERRRADRNARWSPEA